MPHRPLPLPTPASTERHAGRRMLVGAGVTVLIAAAAALGAGANGADAPTTLEAARRAGPIEGTVPPGSPTTTTTIAMPPGLTPVSDADGMVAGYLRAADERSALDEGEPPATLGASEVDFTGLPVVDLQGDQVGWFLSGNVGFVSLAQVGDPDELARIEETWLADQEEARADGG